MLTKLKYFNPILSFPMDIMHVLFEGVVVIELAHLLAYLIDDKKLFTTTWLNTCLTSHQYGYSEVDTKPSPVDRDTTGVYKIRQSGIALIIMTDNLYIIVRYRVQGIYVI